MTEIDWLPEQLKTIKNICETCQILINLNRRDLIPTQLELMQQEIQQVVEENCIKENESVKL